MKKSSGLFRRAAPKPTNQLATLHGDIMREQYDFSNARSNPYVKRLKKQITIRIDEPAIEYFKQLSEELGVPYQSLINLYLRDCAENQRKLDLKWK